MGFLLERGGGDREVRNPEGDALVVGDPLVMCLPMEGEDRGKRVLDGYCDVDG